MVSFKQKVLGWADPWINVPVVGLDISDRSIKYLQFGRQVALESAVFGEIEIPEVVISKGDILQEEVLVKTFKGWLGREGRVFKNSAFAVSLPEEKGFLRLIQVPKIKKGEIDNIVRWEIENNVPVPLDQLIFDYEIAESDNQLDHLDVLTVAFTKASVDSYLKIFKGAGLSVLALEHEAQSLTRALLDDSQITESKIILDIGRTRTGIVIISGGEIVFTTTLELGGINLEENIQKELKVDQAKSLELKKEVGLNKNFEGGKLFSALAPVISALSEELKRVLEFYRTHSHHLHSSSLDVKGLVLAGGDSSLPGLDAYLATILKLPLAKAEDVLTEKLLVNKNKVPSLSKGRLNAYTTAIGLAMKNWE